ncbi:kinesin family member 2/24 [Dendryphion nanum]|uniref:Kinesin-like protein n=1 Tax=Dendryphion nanum TaxID=256645 RepID=A0A9P9DAE4_9PLEO|nr:kinesin family member 2/24 [Dendryphion nanum]
MSLKQPVFSVYPRWRPLLSTESSTAEIQRSISQHGNNHAISLSPPPITNRPQTWKSASSFSTVFNPEDSNQAVFNVVVAPALSHVMAGATCNFFAYGHSGSGKTHTIIGYNDKDEAQLGLCLSAAKQLFQALQELDQESAQEGLVVAVRLYELRGKYAFDLLNRGNRCHVREADGKTHIRGETEMLEDGKVRVRPIVARPCRSFEELRDTVREGLGLRETGSSTIHDESSRTHAVIELEIASDALLSARDAVIERESELVPVGKRATDIYIEEHQASFTWHSDGTYIMNPNRPLNQTRIDAAEAEKREYEGRLKDAESAVADCFTTSKHSFLGGRFVFVDLAGSEYLDRANGAASNAPSQTPQERKQGKEINTDLFALKEVIRARASGQARIPYRSSPLTMVLRNLFQATGEGYSAMILTVSPSQSQFAATVNTLKYGNLVGSAGQSKP